jgi:hypothetical protein
VLRSGFGFFAFCACQNESVHDSSKRTPQRKNSRADGRGAVPR